MRVRGASSHAPRECWLADALRLGVLITLTVSFGLLQAPAYFSTHPLQTAEGWKHVLFDAAWLGSIALIGLQRNAAGLIALIGVAEVALSFSSQTAVGLGDGFIQGPGHFVRPFALILIVCVVAMLSVIRRPPLSSQGTIVWTLPRS